MGMAMEDVWSQADGAKALEVGMVLSPIPLWTDRHL